MKTDSAARRWLVALLIYVTLLVIFVMTGPQERWSGHSAANHYALLAESWLHGRLDLGGPPPIYTGNNDFAHFSGLYFVSFPPFPAVLITPLVAIAGSVERVRDGAFFVCLAPLGPTLLFVLCEQLRRGTRSLLSFGQNVVLAMSFGLGTVYFFTAVQGTVWFAGHVVGVALLVAFMLCSLEARHPLAAGLFLGLAVATRPSLGFALPWFFAELVQLARPPALAKNGATLPWFRGVNWRLVMRRGVAFAAAASVIMVALMWHNYARFSDPTEFGHRLLDVRWRERIDTWGLFSTHYLGRNIAVMLTGLPFYSAADGWQVNGHGLGLWLTSPFYIWAFLPRRATPLYWAAALSAFAVALPNLFYQNTGWIQFGYRFSNDFAPFLIVMIAVGGRVLRTPFWVAVGLAIAVNTFGAATFGKAKYHHYYFIDTTQRIIHPWDLPPRNIKGLAPSR